MRTSLKKFLLPAFVAAIVVFAADRLCAQTFSNLRNLSFTSDGAYSYAGFVLAGDTLYGTANRGGIGFGTIFKIGTNGTGFLKLRNLVSSTDGAYPEGVLIVSGTNFYGTAAQGGSANRGTIFKMNLDGSGFTNLHSFTNGNFDGSYPRAGLVLSGSTLYGTTSEGGSAGNGIVFAISTNGTSFTNLHSFTALLNSTNTDGANPFAGLVLGGSTLYGTCLNGGTKARGTIFAVQTNGAGFTNLHQFSALANNTNSDGANPRASLILSGNTLFGTAYAGGTATNGTLFALNIDGSGFTNFHNFPGAVGGGNPRANLVLSNNTLYGTTERGGSSTNGTVFAVGTNGNGFTILHGFSASTPTDNNPNSDGANPFGGLVVAGSTFYGTTSAGGSSGYGTLFSVTLAGPSLSINRAASNVVLTWPTNAAGYNLQFSTNLVAPITWSPVVPAPTVVNGQNTVTNAITGTQKFYRLSQ